MIDEREKDIQRLCESVLEDCIQWESWSNSYDRYYCVFCHNEVPDSLLKQEVKHDLNCVYLIAKDLSAGSK